MNEKEEYVDRKRKWLADIRKPSVYIEGKSGKHIENRRVLFDVHANGKSVEVFVENKSGELRSVAYVSLSLGELRSLRDVLSDMIDTEFNRQRLDELSKEVVHPKA